MSGKPQRNFGNGGRGGGKRGGKGGGGSSAPSGASASSQQQQAPNVGAVASQLSQVTIAGNVAIRQEDRGNGVVSMRAYAVGGGNPFEVYTNYLQMDLDKSKKYHLYEVNGIPDDVTKQKKLKLMETAIARCPQLANNQDSFATDWKKQIVSWKPLLPNGTSSVNITVPNFDPRKPNAQQGSASLTLRLDHLRSVDVGGLQAYFSGSDPNYIDRELELALTTIVSKELLVNLPGTVKPVSVSKVFTLTDRKDLGVDNKLAIGGFSFGFRPREGTGLLNVTPVMSAFHRGNITVSEYLRGGYHLRGHLVGVRVRLLIDRAPAYKKVAKDSGKAPRADVDDLDLPARRLKTIAEVGTRLAKDQFAYTDPIDNTPCSVWKHMKRYFQRIPQGRGTAGTENSVCVNLGGTKKGQQQWYLAEDLMILPDQIYRGEMSSDMTSAMITKACRKPVENLRAIYQNFLPLLGLTNGQPRSLQNQGITLFPDLVTVPAHEAQLSKVRYARGNLFPREGAWKLDKHVFLSNGNSLKGKVFFLLHNGNQKLGLNPDLIAKFMGHIFTEGSRNGLQLPNFRGFTQDNMLIVNDQFFSSVKTIGETLTKKANVREFGLVVLVLPQNNAAYTKQYAAFKAATDQMVGIPSACICSEKAWGSYGKGFGPRGSPIPASSTEPFSGYAKNVAMKINLRLGYANHSVLQKDLQDAIPGFKDDDNVMILGADVVHPGPKANKKKNSEVKEENDDDECEQNAGTNFDCESCDGGGPTIPSIAAVVGSIDKDFAMFRGSARRQQSGRELLEIRDMESMVKERLQAYKKKRNGLPTRILYYRDGIDEGQFRNVLQVEVNAIRHAWESVSGKGRDTSDTKDLKITAAVVTKRHHTRLYPKDGNHEMTYKQNGNLSPGIVVDSRITIPYVFDFYLISQKALQGTARPAHYIILQNEMGFTPKQMQDLTNMLCYTYGRSTTAVSYVPAAYYADHLCERVKQYLRPVFDKSVDQAEDEDDMWNRGGLNGGNPWHPNMNDTMFWM